MEPLPIPLHEPSSRVVLRNVHSLPFRGDDRALVDGVLSGQSWATAAFHDRFARKVHGLLWRILGPDSELQDTLHDVFVRVFESLQNLRDPGALESWVMGVAVRTAQTRLQSRSRRWWLRFMPGEDLPDPPAPPTDPSRDEALRATYRVLDQLPVDERMALVLRFAAEMTIAEAAEASEVSVSTLKRRLEKAERNFLARAQQEPSLGAWLSRGEP